VTRRRTTTKVADRRQTLAVDKREQRDRVATLRLTVKLVLWATFFTGLFTLHAHLGLRTATLRAETRRLQSRVQDLLDERRQLTNALAETEDSARIRRIAEDQLGMVSIPPADRLLVRTDTVAEVRDAAPLWRAAPVAVNGEERSVSDWIELLAGLWADHDNISG
jgi:cell division protein FtsL